MAKPAKAVAKKRGTAEAASKAAETERPFGALLPSKSEWGLLVALLPMALMLGWVREWGFGDGLRYDVLAHLKFVSGFPTSDLIVDLPIVAIEFLFLGMGRLLVPLSGDLGRYPHWVRWLSGGPWPLYAWGGAFLVILICIALLIWGTGGSGTLDSMTSSGYLAALLLMAAGSPILQYNLASLSKWVLYGIVGFALLGLSYIGGERYGQSLLEFREDSAAACLVLKGEAAPRRFDMLRSYPSGRLVREKGGFMRWIAADDIVVEWSNPRRDGACPKLPIPSKKA